MKFILWSCYSLCPLFPKELNCLFSPKLLLLLIKIRPYLLYEIKTKFYFLGDKIFMKVSCGFVKLRTNHRVGLSDLCLQKPTTAKGQRKIYAAISWCFGFLEATSVNLTTNNGKWYYVTVVCFQLRLKAFLSGFMI